MSVLVRLKMDGHEIKKTSVQGGQTPKWEETFTFPNIRKKDQVEFSVLNKTLFNNEEIIGSAFFVFDDLHNINLKKVITIYDAGKEVGGLHINVNIKSKLAAPVMDLNLQRLGKREDAVSSQATIEEIQAATITEPHGAALSNDDEIDDENSIDFRDHEISR